MKFGGYNHHHTRMNWAHFGPNCISLFAMFHFCQ